MNEIEEFILAMLENHESATIAVGEMERVYDRKFILPTADGSWVMADGEHGFIKFCEKANLTIEYDRKTSHQITVKRSRYITDIQFA